jgi:hypothetical protein
MFTRPQFNVIASDEGFSLKIELARLVYIEGGKYLDVDSSIIASPGGIAIHSQSIQHWNPPYDNESIGEQKRDAILDNIGRALDTIGESMDVV